MVLCEFKSPLIPLISSVLESMQMNEVRSCTGASSALFVTVCSAAVLVRVLVLCSALASCRRAKRGLVAASTPLPASLPGAPSAARRLGPSPRRKVDAGWVCFSPQVSVEGSAPLGRDLAARRESLRLMTRLRLPDLAPAFPRASFILPAWICLRAVYLCGIMWPRRPPQIACLTSVIDSCQSADSSSFPNERVRMKGAYLTPAQQHLLNIFCLFRPISPPRSRQACGSRRAWKYSQPERENGSNQSFMGFFSFSF